MIFHSFPEKAEDNLAASRSAKVDYAFQCHFDGSQDRAVAVYCHRRRVVLILSPEDAIRVGERLVQVGRNQQEANRRTVLFEELAQRGDLAGRITDLESLIDHKKEDHHDR